MGTTEGRILLADHREAETPLITAFLVSAGYEVLTAADGRSAFAALRESDPDLVLLNPGLDGTSGLELLRRLRAAQTTSRLPVILLTEASAIDERVEGREEGADDVIALPPSRTELLLRVKAQLRIRWLENRLEALTDELSTLKSRLLQPA